MIESPPNYPNVTKMVYKDLRGKIINGEFSPGSRLQEDILVKRFGVSKTPIKIALAKLEQNGLVTTIPRRGTYVITLTHELAKEIYSLREVSEGLAARVATQNISDSEIEKLQKVIAGMSVEAEKGNLKEYIELDEAFHTIILKASKHKLLQQFLNSLFDMIALFKFRAASLARNQERSNKEHLSIFKALIKGDARGAETAMRFHIVRVMENSVSNIDEDNANISTFSANMSS